MGGEGGGDIPCQHWMGSSGVGICGAGLGYIVGVGACNGVRAYCVEVAL